MPKCVINRKGDIALNRGRIDLEPQHNVAVTASVDEGVRGVLVTVDTYRLTDQSIHDFAACWALTIHDSIPLEQLLHSKHCRPIPPRLALLTRSGQPVDCFRGSAASVRNLGPVCEPCRPVSATPFNDDAPRRL
jgi:hypothetical protein